jgi:hypothetical protein
MPSVLILALFIESCGDIVATVAALPETGLTPSESAYFLSHAKTETTRLGENAMLGTDRRSDGEKPAAAGDDGSSGLWMS